MKLRDDCPDPTQPSKVLSEEGSLAALDVEVRPTVTVAESRFEIELGNGRCLRVPSVFDAAALKTLLAILDGTT